MFQSLFDTNSVMWNFLYLSVLKTVDNRSLCTELILLSHSCFCWGGGREQTVEVVYAETSNIPAFESAHGEKWEKNIPDCDCGQKVNLYKCVLNLCFNFQTDQTKRSCTPSSRTFRRHETVNNDLLSESLAAVTQSDLKSLMWCMFSYLYCTDLCLYLSLYSDTSAQWDCVFSGQLQCHQEWRYWSM